MSFKIKHTMNEKELMLTSILNCSRSDLYAQPVKLNPEDSARFEKMKERRAEGEPLQYILGSWDFMGLKFLVDERVLIPRPETETLVELALEKAKAFADREIEILDLGTGSGNIAVALAHFIKNCRVTTVDISQDALEVAQHNAAYNRVEQRITFLNGDMKNFLNKFRTEGKTFDMIISNPPYVKRSQLSSLQLEVRREPALALDGGEDGLDFYRVIIAGAADILKHNAFLLFEIGDDQAEDIKNIFASYSGYKNWEIIQDLTNRDRIIIVKRES
ncbi:MAG: protein-(glutamine-N5) methyltransferase, release factor-specific [Omnitrophica WOR_2 bacterium GWA2_47_8]|nr:MAG: protein-(glutamine-N5) methyltransferase, release factor-specific [Omnitrophica WOR_2 bacterium GWA2_47_8]